MTTNLTEVARGDRTCTGRCIFLKKEEKSYEVGYTIWVKFPWRDILPKKFLFFVSLTLHYSNIVHCTEMVDMVETFEMVEMVEMV